MARRTGDTRVAARSYLDTIRMAHPPDALQAAAGLLQLAADEGTAPELLPDSVPRMILNAGRILTRQRQPGHAALYRLVQAAGVRDTAREAVAAAARLPRRDGEPVSVTRPLAAPGGQAP